MDSTATTLLSAEEFLHHPASREATELVCGEIVPVSPAGMRHGELVLLIASELRRFVRAHELGAAFADNLGYHLPIPGRAADTVRVPDVSFVRAAALPAGPRPTGFHRGAPDLAVEVLSPDDRPGEIAARMADYLAAGTRCFWVVDPDARSVTVHVPGRAPRTVGDDAPDASLDGAPVLPGFVLPLAELFADV